MRPTVQQGGWLSSSKRRVTLARDKLIVSRRLCMRAWVSVSMPPIGRLRLSRPSHYLRNRTFVRGIPTVFPSPRSTLGNLLHAHTMPNTVLNVRNSDASRPYRRSNGNNSKGRQQRRVFRGATAGNRNDQARVSDENAPHSSNVDRFVSKQNKFAQRSHKFSTGRLRHRHHSSTAKDGDMHRVSHKSTRGSSTGKNVVASKPTIDATTASATQPNFIPLFEKMPFTYFSLSPEEVIFGTSLGKMQSTFTPLKAKTDVPRSSIYKSSKHPICRVSHTESMFAMSPKSMVFCGRRR